MAETYVPKEEEKSQDWRIQTTPYKKLADGTELLADIYFHGGKDGNTKRYPEPDLIVNHDTTPVVLFFHAGGLTAWSRKSINPSLVQATLKREWTLVSVDYRLLPQATAEDLLEDVKDAYQFVVDRLPSILNNASWARGLDMARTGRRIIVAGASAGTYLAFLAARHYKELSPPPIAVLSYYGVPSFKGPFFNSNHIIWGDQPQPHEKFAALFDSKVVYTGFTRQPFRMESLNTDLSPNKSYTKPADVEDPEADKELPRPDLYDYYVQENLYSEIFNPVEKDVELGPNFPKCVLLHGDDDPDVPLSVSEAFVQEVGPENATLVVAPGKAHCFDNGFFIDDEGVEMQAVRKAWELLDGIVQDTEGQGIQDFVKGWTPRKTSGIR